MRKILAFTLLFAGLFPICANAGCNTPVSLSFEGNQEPDHDEFLYDNDQQFQLTKSGYINSGNKNSGAGRGYECDQWNSGGCTTDDVLTLGPGHVFEGKIVNTKTKYQCLAGYGMNDHWEVVDDGKCHTKQWGDIAVGKSLKKLTLIDCSGYTLSDNSGIEFEGVCREGPIFICKATKCVDGLVANGAGKCVPGKSTHAPKPDDKKSQAQLDCEAAAARGEPANWNGSACNCGDKHVWNVSQKKCVAKQSNGGNTGSCLNRCKDLTGAQKAECAACCVVPSDVAKWNGSKCVCSNATDTFDVQSLQCKPAQVAQPDQPTPVPTPTTPAAEQCDPVKVQTLIRWKMQYAGNAEIVAAINVALDYCNGGQVSIAVFLQLYSEIETLVSEQGSASAAQRVATVKDNISTIYDKIQSMANEFNTSVWKNKDGKFNTSRLISDSVAGVVLGTAGGLITSNVIKKNQLKNGFEDINCTIGGQVVANWGDQFTVGIK